MCDCSKVLHIKFTHKNTIQYNPKREKIIQINSMLIDFCIDFDSLIQNALLLNVYIELYEEIEICAVKN